MTFVKSAKKVSVVIPVYCSDGSLPELLERLTCSLKQTDAAFEIILVDDASPDGTWQTLKELKQCWHSAIKIVRLQKNSGQHNAILCGFTLVSGDIVVTMDDDLQNPPEEIPKLIEAIEHGYDLVIGAYDSKKHSRIRNVSGGLIDRIQRGIFGLPADFQLTSFRAIERIIVENVVQMSGVFPYVTAMLLSHASRPINVQVRHDPRAVGESNYTLRRSVRLAANLVFNYSTIPVFILGIICALAFVFSVIYGSAITLNAFISGSAVPGWASTMVIMSFFNALTLMCLLIFGFYLSRLNQQITRTRVGFTVSEVHE